MIPRRSDLTRASVVHWHKITMPHISGYTPDLVDEMEQWCYDNCGDDDFVRFGQSFWFTSKQFRTAFQLRFS